MDTCFYADLKLRYNAQEVEMGDPFPFYISLRRFNYDVTCCHINDVDVLYLLDIGVYIDYHEDKYATPDPCKLVYNGNS